MEKQGTESESAFVKVSTLCSAGENGELPHLTTWSLCLWALGDPRDLVPHSPGPRWSKPAGWLHLYPGSCHLMEGRWEGMLENVATTHRLVNIIQEKGTYRDCGTNQSPLLVLEPWLPGVTKSYSKYIKQRRSLHYKHVIIINFNEKKRDY